MQGPSATILFVRETGERMLHAQDGRWKRVQRRDGAGQSLAEFALVLPVLLLIVLLGLDLGRAFFGWVTLNNTVRVAANYAATNPDESFAAASAYDSLLRNEGSNAACVIAPGVPPQPVFTDSALDSNTTTKDLGDNATVTISCPFRLLTPIVGGLVGNPVTISASMTFPIRNGPYKP